MAAHRVLRACKDILGRGLTFGPHPSVRMDVYETDLSYLLRFMVDVDVRGGGWVELPAGTYTVRQGSVGESHLQVEVDLTDASQLVAHAPDGEWLKMAPMRVLSFDIECAGRKGVFPTPDMDCVIQIANVVKVPGSDEVVCRNVFALNTCSPIADSDVYSFDTEQELLLAWQQFVVAIDPDFLTGYNIVNFDLPYLLDRAVALSLPAFAYLGRIRAQASEVKEATFSSKAYGTRKNKVICIRGRVQFDVLPILRREYKLRSYTLNAVSAEFLGQQKEDVHFSIITTLQNGTAEHRRRLAVYCLKDAYLPLRLIEKLMLLVNHIEMARVTGVPISFLITRGQQIKVVSQLYRKARADGFLIPSRERTSPDGKYEGATVIEPKRGYYTAPIATLDFASLYPSIMQAHNLCYSTLVLPKDRPLVPPGAMARTPTGDYFVKAGVKQGLLPKILTELLTARSKAKKDMKKATDPYVKAVLNGRQLALKISANSVYGFTGAQVGQLPCLAISSSVTGYGREMIEKTKELVEEQYSIRNGHAHDAVVIYGDTDSVMVKFGVPDVRESIRLGVEAAAMVTASFLRPIKLEFEKVYFPYLLMNKKRYAGIYWTNPDKYDKMDTKGQNR